MGLSVLGENVYHGRRSLIGISQADRLGHMWVLGKTGAGKSMLLTNLIYEDMQAGRGLVVIDLHGDLVESLLGLIPLHRVPDMIYLNPADTAYPLAFNPPRLYGRSFRFPRGEWHARGAQKDVAGVLGATHRVCPPFESLNAPPYPACDAP